MQGRKRRGVMRISIVSRDFKLQPGGGKPGGRQCGGDLQRQRMALNWTGEMLTATLMLSGQVAASAQAVVITHSPSWLIRPVLPPAG